MGARRTRGSGAAAGVAAASPAKPTSHWSVEIANGVRAVGGKDGSKFAAASASATSAKTRNAVAEAARTLFARLTAAYAERSETTSGGTLPLEDGELTTEGLDAEQVWTQMEAQTTPVLEACKRAIKALGKRVKSSGEDVDMDALFDVGADELQSDEEDDDEEDEEDKSGSEDESTDNEDSEEANARSKSGKKSGGSDRTSKYFRNPGMFSLDDMENFLDEAEEEAEERRKVEDEEEDGDNDKERGSDEDDDSDDEGDIYRELSESDDDGDDDEEDSEEADDLDDALAYTAKLAGVSASTRRIKDKKPKGKKAQDMMFEDFFSKHKGKPLGGTKGGKLGASTDAELNELSDEEEDMFNELEGDEDLDEEDDDLDGELETGIAGNRGLENHDDDKDEYMEEDEDDEEDEELDIGGDTEMDALDKQLDAQLDAEIARAEQEGDYEKDEEDDMPAQPNAKSAFQRQQDALARQMDKLESAALGEKSWLLKGEADAKQRPLNSALETDLEFEHVMAPAPVISAEITQKLEDIIKQRIIEGRFDDVERIEPVQERERKEAPQLDDTKSSKGLGEIYADEYMKQKVGVALGEKEDPIVAEVKKLWALLSYRLDALSRTGFVEEPKDIEARIDRELALRAQGNLVPATFNETTHQAPEEIFAGGDGKGGQRGSAAGNVKADDELTKEERKAGRAKRKRKSKAVREERDRVKSQRDRQREAQLKAEEEAGFTRKAPKVAMLAAAPAGGKSKSDFSKSSKVFGMLQEAKEADAARGGPLKKSKSDSTKNKSSLKL